MRGEQKEEENFFVFIFRFVFYTLTKLNKIKMNQSNFESISHN